MANSSHRTRAPSLTGGGKRPPSANRQTWRVEQLRRAATARTSSSFFSGVSFSEADAVDIDGLPWGGADLPSAGLATGVYVPETDGKFERLARKVDTPVNGLDFGFPKDFGKLWKVPGKFGHLVSESNPGFDLATPYT